MNDILSPPFPWFGGKRKIAPIVWKLFGDVPRYIEPFFGGGAVLLGRPKWHKNLSQENINDKDMLVVNFWRAVKYSPEKLVEYVDYPISEGDLTARHLWLVSTGIPELRDKLLSDPEYFDPKIAGWWVWGISQWIGDNWCRGDGKWIIENGKFVEKTDKSQPGVANKRPNITSGNIGILRKTINLNEYIHALSERLRYVRIVCGDWSRMVTRSMLGETKNRYVGIFLDPPYRQDLRFSKLYNVEDNISKQVNEWCVEHGDNPYYRIALCGYEGEHNNLEELGWKKISWVGSAAYQTSKRQGKNLENRYKERIWYNKACLNLEDERSS